MLWLNDLCFILQEENHNRKRPVCQEQFMLVASGPAGAMAVLGIQVRSV
jgi:hypothetical protein